MLPSAGWLYLGANSVWPSKYRLTLPQCVFDEYAVLSRDRGGWWIYDEDAEAIQIANKAPDVVPEVARFAELSSPGDGGSTRFFTVPGEFRVLGTTEPDSRGAGDEKAISREGYLDHHTKLHFVSATSLVSGDLRSFYLFTLDQLENRVDDTDVWADDARSIARLLDSEASHLVSGDATEAGSRKIPATDGIPSSKRGNLEARLDIQRGDVPDEFTVQYETIEIEDVPRTTYSDISLKYLLVRYGTSEQTKQNPAEDPELVKVLNKVVDVETTYSERNRVITAEVPFCIHERHAAEFKLFAEVTGSDSLDSVRAAFSESSSCSSASISDSLEDRVYMVHRDFQTTETSGGFINNVVYSQ